MTKRTRRNHTATFKAKVALEALKGEQTLVELSQRFGIHQNLITKWKKQLLDNAQELFADGARHEGQVDVKELHAKIGELTMVNDFLSGSARAHRRSERKEMIDRAHELPLTKQCKILNLSRSSIYYNPAQISEKDLRLMREIDDIHLKYPFYGSRRIRNELWDRGYRVGRGHVGTLMKKMGIEALYPKPRTSKPNPAHKVYPYLLRSLSITQANHVWCADITYLPMAKGFCYLVAVMDWAGRKVLSWRLSNTLDTSFCLEALEEAIENYGTPEIFNTDQGCQFTSEAFTGLLHEKEVKISMDGKGRWLDNVFIERLWRSVKYEEVYIKAYGSIPEARRGLAEYFELYNERRRHQGLDDLTPDEVYFATSDNAA
ncbi:MAG: IS3 family transposase [Actinomycetota bacterium]|nr:IS3 family transposase [Actinomycetota bacterium]